MNLQEIKQRLSEITTQEEYEAYAKQVLDGRNENCEWEKGFVDTPERKALENDVLSAFEAKQDEIDAQNRKMLEEHQATVALLDEYIRNSDKRLLQQAILVRNSRIMCEKLGLFKKTQVSNW